MIYEIVYDDLYDFSICFRTWQLPARLISMDVQQLGPADSPSAFATGSLLGTGTGASEHNLTVQ